MQKLYTYCFEDDDEYDLDNLYDSEKEAVEAAQKLRKFSIEEQFDKAGILPKGINIYKVNITFLKGVKLK